MEIDQNVIMESFLLASVVLSTLMALRKIGVSKQQTVRNDRYLLDLEGLDRQIRIDPTDAFAVWRKAEIYEAMGEHQMCLRFYRTAHTMCPKAYSAADYTEAFDRVSKVRPDLGFRLHALPSGSR